MQTTKKFRYCLCEHCEFLYQNPKIPSVELQSYYPKVYYSYGVSAIHKPNFLVRLRLAIIEYTLSGKLPKQFLLKLFTILFRNKFSGLLPAQFGNGREFLDIGCGSGQNLHIMSRFGWNCTGIEISEEAVSIIKRNGFAAKCGGIDALTDVDKYSAVRLWHVLEHLPEVNEGLERISNAMKVGGELYLAVPNYKSIYRMLFNSFWIGFDAPRHTCVFSPKSIKKILTSHGFEVTDIKHSSTGGFVQSLDNLVTKIFNSKYRPFSTVLGVIFFYPLDYVVDLLTMGDILFVRCKKNDNFQA